MLACNRLRIDSGDGSPVLEYRIEYRRVESRMLETDWQELSPDEISSHVRANTVVAEWLRRRIGLHKLLRSCTPDFPRSNRHQNHTDQIAA
jgi:hypothetical protein